MELLPPPEQRGPANEPTYQPDGEEILPPRAEPWRQNEKPAGWVWGADEGGDQPDRQAVAAASLAVRRARQKRKRQWIRAAKFTVIFAVLTPLVTWGVVSVRDRADVAAAGAHFDDAAETTFNPAALGVTPRVGLRPASYPPVAADQATAPLGRPNAAALASTSRSYSFITRQPDGRTPVTWDPCRPVHYTVRRDNEPDFGERILTEAIARVSAATGLRFVRDVDTDERTNFNREAIQAAKYGNRWAPVLITWSSPGEERRLTGGVIGLGGSHPVANNFDTGSFVSGSLALDAPQMVAASKRPNGMALAKAVVLHELGHVVGLGHVSDPRQIMYPEANDAVVDYQDGDLAGLAKLGQGPCNPGT